MQGIKIKNYFNPNDIHFKFQVWVGEIMKNENYKTQLELRIWRLGSNRRIRNVKTGMQN